MPDKTPPEDRSFPPPPMDPFPTYQTHYPRSIKDDEQNPFIQFRRFADEQVSSLFAGFPQFFGLSPSSAGRDSDHWRREVDDMMRQRHEWEEGFRKQFEQDMEEMRLQLEKSKTEAWKSMEEAWKHHSTQNTNEDQAAPWWTRGKAAKCPALNGQAPQKNATNCPALYDEHGNPRTELDAYNGLQPKIEKQVQVIRAPVQELPKPPSTSWFSALGWDGQQKQRQSSGELSAPEDTSSKADGRLPRPTSYSLWAARGMQPFDNSNETIPWLMLSPYSPIYLCNPAQSRLLRVRIQDSEGIPLQISNARFFARWYTDVDEKMARSKPWADAFEDLLSLQQTGKMVDRDGWNTWRTPSTWIHDMASRGSLGDRWAFNEQGMLAKRPVPSDSTLEAAIPSTEDRCGRWRKHRECRRNKSRETAPVQHEVHELPANEVNVIVDRVTDALAPYPLFGSIISAADAIVSAVDQATEKELQSQAEASTSASASTTLPEVVTEHTNASSDYSSSSSSSTSYNDAPSEPTPTASIISTLTTTTTRTLPNGSVETKRVLKRRFSDGSEESDESVEVKGLPSQLNSDAGKQPTPSIATLASTQNKENQTQAQSPSQRKQFPKRIPVTPADGEQVSNRQEITPAPRRGGGWFWN